MNPISSPALTLAIRNQPHSLLEFVKSARVKITQVFAVATFLSAIGLPTSALQAAGIWDGGGGVDTNWGTAANWDNNIVPTSSTSTVITLGLGTATSPVVNLNNPWQIQQLVFQNSGNVNLTGNTLASTGTSSSFYVIDGNASTGILTINNNFSTTLSGTNRFQVRSGTGGLTLNGNIEADISGTSSYLMFRGGNAITVNGAVSGSSGTSTALTKTDGGTLYLNNSNNKINVLLMVEGTIILGADNALGQGAALNFGGTLGNPIIDLNGRNQILGGLVMNAGTTQPASIRNNSVTSSNLTYSRTSAAGDETYGSSLFTINGNLSFTKQGTNTLTLSGGNTYTGLTDVQGGTLRYGASNVIAGGAVQVSGGTLDLVTFSDTVGAVTLQSGSITSTTGTLTGTAYNMQSGSASAILAGAVNLTKTSSGTVTLSGANTYTGVTTLTDGTLSVGTIGNGNVAGNLGKATNLATNLVFNGGTLKYTGSTATSDRAFTINSGKTAIIETANNLSLAGATGAATTGALTKTGAGILTLTGVNTNTGGTTVSAGTLAIGASDRLADTGAVTVNAGVFDVGTFSDTVGAVTLTGGSITGSGGTLTGSSYGVQSGSISAKLAGAVNLNKTTAGVVALSGANTYSGTTTLTTGTLQAGNNAAFGTSALALNGGKLSSDSGTAYAFGNAVTFGGDVTLGDGTNTGVLTFNGAGTLTGNRTITTATNVTYAGVIGGGANGLTKAGTGSLTFSAVNTYVGDTIVSGGTLILSGSGSVASSKIQVQQNAALTATSGLQLQSGQRLENKGTFTGSLTALAGSIYAPGNSPGIATQAGDLALNTGSTFEWELVSNTNAGAGTEFDQTVFTAGGLTIETGVTANLNFTYSGSDVLWTDAFWSSNQQWLVFTGADSLVAGAPAIFTTINVGVDSGFQSLASVRSGASFSFTSIGDDVYLTYSIPEPSTTLLLTGALTALVIFRRRRA